MSRTKILATALAAATAALTGTAHAAPTPFGHECTPEDGVRSCPTTSLDQRVPSFDGTPLDVDVTLPEAGDGPFPTIMLLHGLGGTKRSFAEPSATNPGYDAKSFARAGYAVVTPTARGFGDSCGRVESRTAGCEGGFTRLGDMRYEVRDVQTLAGLLVDQGIAQPNAIGATGISYGGGMSTMLAFLRDRIRLTDGTYAPWVSPNGIPLSIRAAWPRWLWSNGESIFLRNGRASAWSRTPTGVPTKAYAGGIFAVGFSGFTAPTGGPIDTDVRKWKAQLDAGTLGAEIQPTLDVAYDFHGVAGVPLPAFGPAPLLLQSGWTDQLFPVGQSLAAYDAVRRAEPRAHVALQFGDLGHAPGANLVDDNRTFNAQGLAFLDGWLKRGAPVLTPGEVTVFTMNCAPGATRGGGPFTAASWGALTRGTASFRTKRALRISSRGGDEDLAESLSPLGATASHCTPRSPDRGNRAQFAGRVRRAVTLLGRPVLSGRVRTAGDNGQIVARLWDLNPRTGEQLLITRGAYRLNDDQRGRFRFTLDGNGWRFARGHRVVVELLGRDDPTFGPSPTSFRARLTKLRMRLPVRERVRG